MYDVVEIATGVVISEWHTEKEAQEQVDRFNNHTNGKYYEVRKHKIKVKFVGVNNNGYNCYVTEKGSYLADINGEFYALNQYPEEGFEGIDGEPDFKVDKNKLEIVEDFEL